MTKSKTSTQTPSNARVLAIDPGFDRVGLAVMEKVLGKEKLIFSTCLETNRKLSSAKRLEEIGLGVKKVIAEHAPTEVAIEKLFFNQNITTGIRVAEARGVVLYEAAQKELEIYEYSPQEVKVAVTGYGKASKPDLVRLTMRLLNLSRKPRFDDEMDAIALCITHLASKKTF
jgi:crossover junction endodeoxyribonuclease RuvC